MDKIDQIKTMTFSEDERIAARVDYKICDNCGFRLMRVETTIVGNQKLILKRCPICEQLDHDHPGEIDILLSDELRSRYFDTWLALHGLSPDTLEYHYRLKLGHFFAMKSKSVS